MGNNDLWDDPEWEDLRRLVNKQPARPKNKKAIKDSHKPKKPVVPPLDASDEPKKVEVSVNVTLPKFTLPKFKLPAITQKQRKIGLLVGVTGIVLIGGMVVVSVLKGPATPRDSNTQQEKPSFDTLTPNGKDQSEVGPLVKISPPGNEPVFAYVDKIGENQIKVSQQQLPEKLRTNTDEEIKTLAENFGATRVIKGSNPKAYIGIDVSGAQSVVLSKNGLLILMNSTKELEDYEWAEYIIRLK